MTFADEPLSRKKKNIIENKPASNTETSRDLDHITTIEELHRFINEFPYAELRDNAISTVISSGPTNSPVMIIGEAPGAEEDEQGKPFVGRSGKLINEELKAVGIDRNKIYVSNIVNWRPPGNRPPTVEEINIFKPIIKKHIELVNPKYLLLLGSTSMNALYKTDLPISKVRGVLSPYNEHTSMLVTFHPSYILRSEKNRIFLQQDFKLLHKALSDRNLLCEVAFEK